MMLRCFVHPSVEDILHSMVGIIYIFGRVRIQWSQNIILKPNIFEVYHFLRRLVAANTTEEYFFFQHHRPFHSVNPALPLQQQLAHFKHTSFLSFLPNHIQTSHSHLAALMPWIYGQQMTLEREGESHLIPLITVPVRLSEGQKLISCLAFPASAHRKAHPLDCLGFTSAKDCEPFAPPPSPPWSVDRCPCVMSVSSLTPFLNHLQRLSSVWTCKWHHPKNVVSCELGQLGFCVCGQHNTVRSSERERFYVCLVLSPNLSPSTCLSDKALLHPEWLWLLSIITSTRPFDVVMKYGYQRDVAVVGTQ